MEKMGTLKKNGDQKTNFGPHGDQSPQMGTNVGAVDFDSDETSQDLESQSTTESTSQVTILLLLVIL